MATRTTPTTVLDIIERDPDDNRVLECATAAQCEFVVTCVNDLLTLRSHLRDQMRERPDLTAITRAGPVIVRGSGPLPTYARDEPRPAGAPALFVGIAQQQGALDQRAQEGRLRKRIRLSLLCGRARLPAAASHVRRRLAGPDNPADSRAGPRSRDRWRSHSRRGARDACGATSPGGERRGRPHRRLRRDGRTRALPVAPPKHSAVAVMPP